MKQAGSGYDTSLDEIGASDRGLHSSQTTDHGTTSYFVTTAMNFAMPRRLYKTVAIKLGQGGHVRKGTRQSNARVEKKLFMCRRRGLERHRFDAPRTRTCRNLFFRKSLDGFEDSNFAAKRKRRGPRVWVT
jgi:hypothetical protein